MTLHRLMLSINTCHIIRIQCIGTFGTLRADTLISDSPDLRVLLMDNSFYFRQLR
jgi:hypothetical protein